MKKIAIFVSGSGSNAEKIIDYFKENDTVSVELLLTNNPKAGAILRGYKLGIPTLIFDRSTFTKTDKIPLLLKQQGIDLVVLAGFLWLIPINLIQAFPERIVNIHPALLPKYGGKGMWGHHVHEAVVVNQERESGITIHFVNEKYDEGKHILQKKCSLNPADSAEEVAAKVLKLEHEYFPKVIEEILNSI